MCAERSLTTEYPANGSFFGTTNYKQCFRGSEEVQTNAPERKRLVPTRVYQFQCSSY